jgi:hypothetical protein
MEAILKNINSFKNVRIYLITEDPLDRMKVFYTHYKLASFDNITVGQDYNFDMLKHFEIPTTPFIVLYDQHRKAKAIIKGPIAIERIIDQISKL